MLKHTENLVQDLQEELDMKDAVTVKDLNDGPFESQRLDNSYVGTDDSTESSCAQVLASCPNDGTDERDQPLLSNTIDIGEFSRIEAELEAELERLELNMNASSLEGKISALGEVSPKLSSFEVYAPVNYSIHFRRTFSFILLPNVFPPFLFSDQPLYHQTLLRTDTC